jgi:hypothetical protein
MNKLLFIYIFVCKNNVGLLKLHKKGNKERIAKEEEIKKEREE